MRSEVVANTCFVLLQSYSLYVRNDLRKMLGAANNTWSYVRLGKLGTEYVCVCVYIYVYVYIS